MADEAYRAVFLRVHPTGKMVLSLTTESDGKEAEYAQLVADELGVPALDVKVVPADTDRFGVGHGYNTSPSERHLGGDRQRHREDSRQGAAARGRGAGDLAGDASSGRTVPGSARTEATPRRSRRSRRSRSTRTAPAPCRRESRAGSTRRPSTAIDRIAARASRADEQEDQEPRHEREGQRGIGGDVDGDHAEARGRGRRPAPRRSSRRRGSRSARGSTARPSRRSAGGRRRARPRPATFRAPNRTE